MVLLGSSGRAGSGRSKSSRVAHPQELGGFQWRVQQARGRLRKGSGWFESQQRMFWKMWKEDRGQGKVLKMKDLMAEDDQMASLQ